MVKNVLQQVLDPLVRPQGGGRKRGGKRRARSTNAGGARAFRARNPGSRNPIRRTDNMLSLTRDQFTATSPLNLFQIGPGSTPGGVRVQGRELLSAVELQGPLTGGFQLARTFNGQDTQFALPGDINPYAFPRLQNYGPMYEYFKFHKLSVLFQSNQPTTQGGEVIMCIDYDPTDSAPGSTAAMMRNVSSTMANVYSDASLQLIGSLSRLPKYECVSSLIGLEALQALQGKIYVALEGITNASTSVITYGYIVVQYDVEFFTPQ